MQKKLCMYGESIMTNRIYQKWFAKFFGTIDIFDK